MAGILEVCVDSLASAREAIAGGADRLEVCSALPIGGLTPYTALLRQIREESAIPIRCLMRPRARAFHMSGKVNVESGMIFRREGIAMGVPSMDEWHIPQTSEAAIRAARLAMDA